MRARAVVAVAVAAALVAPIGWAPGALAVEPPADLVVEPADGLVDHQGVWLVGRGFQRGEELLAVECVGEPTPSTCDFSVLLFFGANRQGRFRVLYEAHRVVESRRLGRVDCADRATPCSFVVLDGAGGPRAEAKLSFDPDAPLPDYPRAEPAVRHEVRLGSAGQLVVEGTVSCTEDAAAYLVVQVEQQGEIPAHAYGFGRVLCGHRVAWTVRAEPVDGPPFHPGEASVAVVAFAEAAPFLGSAGRTVATVDIRG